MEKQTETTKQDTIFYKEFDLEAQEYSMEKSVDVPIKSVAHWVKKNNQHLFMRWERN